MDFESSLFFEVLVSNAFLKGAAISLSLATLSQLVAIFFGFFLAIFRFGQEPST